MIRTVVYATAAVIMGCAVARADSGTIIDAHWGNLNNCFAVTLTNGNTYGLTFGVSQAPDFTATQITSLGSSVGKLVSLDPSGTVTCNGQDLPGIKNLHIFQPQS